MNGYIGRLTSVTALVATLAAVSLPLQADVLFGYRPGRGESARELSRKGRFFATSDYSDVGNDWGLRTRARTITKTGSFPSYNRPWTSDGRGTLFGVQFDDPITPNYPGQFDRFTNGIPLFTRAIIQWKENVPAKDAWAACIRTPEGRLVKLRADTAKPIYPFDRTTIEFDPTPIKTFYVGLKELKEGNAADVEDIQLYIPPERASVTNGMAVWHPGFYLAVFNTLSPGMIEGVTPVNAFSISHATLYYHGLYEFDLFYRMTPFIDYNGTNLLPARRDYFVKTAVTGDEDVAEYSLVFDVPGRTSVTVAVRSVFRQSSAKSLEFAFTADALPSGARLGYRFLGPVTAFAKILEATPVLSGASIPLATPAGRLQFDLEGSRELALFKEPGDKAIRFETRASGRGLTLAISLPLGAAGKPQPEILNYAWRPSLAGEGDPGLAPFTTNDLELLDEIDCGNPSDPHPYFDSSNDPAIAALRKKYGTLEARAGQQKPYGYLAFLDKPGDGAVPITTVAGKACRAIPDKFGAYFRYNLKTAIKPRTPYLVVVEHAFDQLRRGEFHSIWLDSNDTLQHGSLLFGGFETSGAPENGYRTESVLCHGPLKRGFQGGTNSIVFSGVYSDGGGWERAPGPAVKSIRIYRVKTMPALPDIAPLVPPPGVRRSLQCLTELCDAPNPLWLFQYPKLVGYDGMWTYHDPMSRFFGGSSNLRRGFHPGSLAGNRQLFEAAQGQGLFVNLHLGQLLNLGFGDGDDDSFTGAFHGSYNGETVPFKPTRQELAHIAKALKVSLAALSKYTSLKEVSLADNTQDPCVWSERNVRDFCADTGTKLTTSPLYLENAHAILNGGPEVVRAWMRWSCAERFKFHQWLLSEIRQYRPDLSLTLSRSWYRGLITCFESPGADPLPGVTRTRLGTLGIKTYPDFLRFMGVDPDLYAGRAGFSLEVESNLRIAAADKRLPSLYANDWFRQVKDDFRTGGLSIMVNYCYEEHSKPLRAYSTIFVRSREQYRKGLIEALLFANARNITLPTYNEPWSGRLDDLRQFVVPYRLLPFADPVPYGGTCTDSSSQAVIGRYGDRYGLVNAGNKDTVVRLALPSGQASVIDLSSGVPRRLATVKAADGTISVSLPMSPWSLKTLEID